MELQDAYASCVETLQQLDYERYLACLFADKADQAPLIALHSLNAELGRIRESVSEAMLGQIRLTWWREAIEGLAQGQVRAHPVIEALAPALETGRFSGPHLVDMVEARIGDLYEDGPANQSDLKDYAARTGGTVMQQALNGFENADKAEARRIGLAMTQGGVVRSIAFHAAMRRVHLPGDALAQMGVSAEDIFQGTFSPEIASLARTLGEEALAQLEDGLRQTWSKRSRRALTPAVFALQDLRAARRSGFDPEKPQQAASRATKLLKSWWFIQTGRV
jgi:phytoene synthase